MGVDKSSHSYTNGPPSDTESIALRSQVTRKDFRRHQKGGGAPSGSITKHPLSAKSKELAAE